MSISPFDLDHYQRQGGIGGMIANQVIGRTGHRRRDWLSPSVVVGMLRMSDAMVVLMAAVIAYFTRFRDFDDLGTFQIYGSVVAVLLALNIFQLAGLYKFGQLTSLFAQSGRLLLSWAVVMTALLSLGFLAKVPLI